MSNVSSNWNAIMQYSFIRIFANDGTIDADELAMLERLAMADGLVDDRERNVLTTIFSRVNPELVSEEVRQGIEQFKARHRIP
jgi:tellurite resistance protein